MSDSEIKFAAVLLDQNLKKPLDYSVPPQWANSVQVGMRVEVPLRTSLIKATIVALKKSSSVPNPKAISRLLTTDSALSDNLWKLANWMATYYCAPLQRTLKCFIPPNLRKEVKPKKDFLFFLSLTKDKAAELIPDLRTKHPEMALVLDKLLEERKGISASDMMQELKISRSPIETLLKKKWIKKEEKPEFDVSEEEFFPAKPKKLNEEQKTCLDKILSSPGFSTHLIQGVTGSGKTEIYLQAIAAALEKGQSSIMLVPEVALTSQTIERFRSRFQEKIAIWHHRRSLGERTLAWERLKSGEAKVVIGARSAIFCPAQNVGLIIVDEEHDSSYKQSDDIPCYNGRDIAVMRGYLEKATVLLGSATPSLESRYNCELGKYVYHTLKNRAANASMPSLTIIDMKVAMDRSGGFTHFSQELIDGMKRRLEMGEQTLLFLNRRGYHRNQTCASCRSTVKCPHCDLGLTFHKSEEQLRCHLCDFCRPVPSSCPTCGSRDSLQFKGFGTEHVERSLHALMPGIRTLRMDKDTTKGKLSHEDLYKQFRAHKADVLIGTQMIAKGFHFPSVTLVGVLNADASLMIPDFRSAETVFQLITQVAGRAGRAELKGEVILQTFLPDHPILKLAAAQDYDAFYAAELQERKLFGFPPYSHLIKISCSGEAEKEVESQAKKLYEQIKQALPPGVELLPVLPSGHAKVKDQFRFQFVIKTLKIASLQPVLQSLILPPGSKIDIDALNTFF
jgi:primosomal protein N' (replication factor Y)